MKSSGVPPNPGLLLTGTALTWSIRRDLIRHSPACRGGCAAAAPLVEMTKAAAAGAVPWMTVTGSAMPLIDVLCKLSLLVAALSTVGIFLRLRTASLTEIQLRLAALEEMLASRPD